MCTASAVGGKATGSVKRVIASKTQHFRGVMFNCGVSQQCVMKNGSCSVTKPFGSCLSANCVVANYLSVKRNLRYKVRAASGRKLDLGILQGDYTLNAGFGFDAFEDCLGASPSIFTQLYGPWFKMDLGYATQGVKTCFAYMPVSLAGAMLGARVEMPRNVVVGAVKVSSAAGGTQPVFSCGAGYAMTAANRVLLSDFRAVAGVSMRQVDTGIEVAYANVSRLIDVSLGATYRITQEVSIACNGTLGSYAKNFYLGYSKGRISVAGGIGTTDSGYMCTSGRVGFAVASEFK